MAEIPFDIFAMLNAPGVRPQLLQAVEALAGVLSSPTALARAYRLCSHWQRRFELALRSEVPDWSGLAAFRYMLDFSLPPTVIDTLRSPSPPASAPNCLRELTSLEECRLAYHQYLIEKRDLHAGKFLVSGTAADWLLAQLKQCRALPGGQAGNILWLWQTIGAQARAFAPYCSRHLATQVLGRPPLAGGQLLWLQDGVADFRRLAQAPDLAGFAAHDGRRHDAPTATSLTVVEGGRRLIFQLPGFRLLGPDRALVWEKAQFTFQGQPLTAQPLKRPAESDTWPSIPLFGECRLQPDGVLEIALADAAQMAATVAGRADFAIIGGMDAIFYDPWLQSDPQLQARLLTMLEKQLRALAGVGVRIGLELSGLPRREYAHFIQRLCRDDVIVALGINGVDELPQVTGQESLGLQLYDWWLDPQQLPAAIQPAAQPGARPGQHFEYLTYKRAGQLAQATGVRTLYVHTLTLDFILRRDADPGALLRAQLGDMMGKGLVIAALLQRNYGNDWLSALKKMTPAVNPTAMAKLGRFAQDYDTFEPSEPGAQAGHRLLSSGYRLASKPGAYSLAVVPVVWPHVSDEAAGDALPADMNPTGAGDMTFGAFFLLGGV